MSNLTTFFGGSSSSGGSTSAINATSYARFKRLDFLATATSISGDTGYIGGIGVTPMNDTHFVIHYTDNNQYRYLAKLFRLNDDYSVTAIGNWTAYGAQGSASDADFVSAGNGYRDVFFVYRNSSQNRVGHFQWDGSTGISSSNVINQTGNNVPLNNCSCLIDGTLVAQVHEQNSNVFFYSRTLAGNTHANSSGTSFNGSSSVCGSVGMESSVHSISKVGSSDIRHHRLYRSSSGTFFLNTANIDHNESFVYNPTNLKCARSGNGVVFVIQNNDTANRYGNTMIEGYCGDQSAGFQWHRVNINNGYTQGHGYAAQTRVSNPASQVDFGSFNRQYNGTYLDRGYIVDFGDDTRFKVSRPYEYLARQSSTADWDSAQRQCIMGDKVIQVHKIGSSAGSQSMEFDFWKLT